jgi:hypothetical protein
MSSLLPEVAANLEAFHSPHLIDQNQHSQPLLRLERNEVCNPIEIKKSDHLLLYQTFVIIE